nr:glycoside hydrolase family 2 TIM barrel-domain containing protein [uncultured Pedobacter sp.]
MKKILKSICIVMGLISLLTHANAQSSIAENFSNSAESLNIIGRGITKIENGVFTAKDAYACFGDKNLKDFRFTFEARAPKTAKQVQIWAGFRAFNRFDRYIIGFRGGLQNNLYLSRMGYMGADELLGLSNLHFKPQTGKWYKFKIEVVGNRIRVFINNEVLPRIDVVDPNSNLAPSGSVTLGGGWIETEFDNLTIEPLKPTALDGLSYQVYTPKVTDQQKETQREKERSTYVSKKVDKLNALRTEISLDGKWLFKPDYEITDQSFKDNPSIKDSDWHIMNVPDFWNPIRIWLHGETMNDNKFPKGVSDAYYTKETERCEAYTFDYTKVKSAWYRQWIELPAGIENKSSELVLDAVSKMADVYVNGKLVTSHIGMFGEIRKDISKFLHPGKNLISVFVTKDYIKDIEDAEKVVDVSVTVPVTNAMLKDIAHGFYKDSPAGIWQPVKLIISNPVKIEDVFIHPALDGASFDVTLKNYSTKKAKFNLATDILEDKTHLSFYAEKSLNGIELNPGETKVVTYTIKNLKPRLWSPQAPNLYDFNFKLVSNKGKELDLLSIRSGFRTFESKNGLLYLNGIPYWLRGANQTPFALAPNDTTLANGFYKIMKAGNIEVTRTHTTPYNELWINAADENGIGISHEGTWPWLMIQSSMPDKNLIDMWADEYLSLLKKYRNHPSILFWTVNNEMKFYKNDPDEERRKVKMKIISDVVKRMREIDPTRPICFDSNYRRNEKENGKDFYKGIDDGDIDDVHAYINWYNHSVFEQFNGEFQKSNLNPGRPLISQEMSTGYPNNETGHATRFYTLVHQNPQSLIGYRAYEYGNPNLFLKVQSFITGELAEALRRSNDKASGILHFALITWFRNVYDAKTIEPYPTYFAIKRALQPVLVSAEIWGRNFFAGDSLRTRFCIVNDLENGRELKEGVINWWIETENGEKIAAGKVDVSKVGHYKRVWLNPTIKIPKNLKVSNIKAKLKLSYTEGGQEMSANEYEIFIAEKTWPQVVKSNEKIALVDNANSASSLDFIKVEYTKANNIMAALAMRPKLIVFSAIGKNVPDEDIKAIKAYIRDGGKVILLNSEEASKAIFPEYITGWIKPTEGDIVNMEIPESEVFDNIDLLALRYFNNNQPGIPKVCYSAFSVNRNPNVKELASNIKIHGYIQGEMSERKDYMKTIKGFPLLKITDGKGSALISSMAHEKTKTDPIAAMLLSNMINNMLR